MPLVPLSFLVTSQKTLPCAATALASAAPHREPWCARCAVAQPCPVGCPKVLTVRPQENALSPRGGWGGCQPARPFPSAQPPPTAGPGPHQASVPPGQAIPAASVALLGDGLSPYTCQVLEGIHPLGQASPAWSAGCSHPPNTRSRPLPSRSPLCHVPLLFLSDVQPPSCMSDGWWFLPVSA